MVVIRWTLRLTWANRQVTRRAINSIGRSLAVLLALTVIPINFSNNELFGILSVSHKENHWDYNSRGHRSGRLALVGWQGQRDWM